MTILTTAQQARLRTRPHLTKLYLSIYQPSTVLAVRLNNSEIVKGAMRLDYDTLSAGSYHLVQSGMTLYVGSTPGAFDKGTVRVKSANAVWITVAENSHIEWADDDYLTIVNFYEINAVYPRIIQDPEDDTKTIWYKDYDIAYTNQNSILGTFINMGPHHAGLIENGSCNVFYSASGTYNLLEENLSYHWFFEGANTTGSSVHTPGNIAYATPGHYTTRLIVSGTSSGAVDVSYRHISIYNRPGEGPTTPIQRWEMTNLSGSRDQGGYTASFRLHEFEDAAHLREGSLIVIFAEDWYGDTLNKQSYGGNALNRSQIVFMGYVIKGSIQYNWRDSFIDFEAGSPSEIMKLSEGFSVSVQYSADPSTATADPDIPSGWVAVLEMDVRRALYHYLRWHSTVLMTTDFQFVGTDRFLQFFDADRTSIYDAVQSAMKSILVGAMVCDRQGKLWAERDLYIEPLLFPVTMTLSKPDWIGDVSIDEDRSNQVSYLEMGGVYFTGTDSYPYLSEAPGPTPSYRGSVEKIQGLALLSQAELNTICGRVFGQRNATYPSIELHLSGNYRNFDIAPQENIPLTIAATDTVRGIAFTGKRFIANRMEWKYDPIHESFMPVLSLAERMLGPDGETLTIPVIPPPDGYNPPPPPDIPPPVIPPVVIPTGGSNMAFVPFMSGYDSSQPIGERDRYSTAGAIKYSAGEDIQFHAFIAVPPSATTVVAYFVFSTTIVAGDVLNASITLTAMKPNADYIAEGNSRTAGRSGTIDSGGTRSMYVTWPTSVTLWTSTGAVIDTYLHMLDTSTANAVVYGVYYIWS